MSTMVERYLARYGVLKAEKSNWLNMYQLLGEYVHYRKQNFTTTYSAGTFIVNDVYDSTAKRAANIMATMLVGMLLPTGGKSFLFQPPEGLEITEEVKTFYDNATQITTNIMDDATAGLTVAMFEYMLDEVIFGTSGLGAFEKEEYPYILFKAWNVKSMYIDENADGRINVIFNEIEMTVRKAIEKYGLNAVSEEVRKNWNEGKEHEKIKVLHIIEELMPFERKEGEKPVVSLHIEMGSNTVLKKSGFEEFPVFVVRFYKIMGDIQGGSPAIDVFPDILEVNAAEEIVTTGAEKLVEPPLGLIEGALGGDELNTSRGAFNVFSPVGQIQPDKAVFPLYTVGDVRHLAEKTTRLRDNILNAFAIDRLLDLNNDTRMTLGEAQIRDKMRGDSLGSIFARQEAELLTPLINRVFNILLQKGIFGLIEGSEKEKGYILQGKKYKKVPKLIVSLIENGEDVYTIKYISPAKRMMHAEEIQGMLANMQFASEAAQVVPKIVDNLDEDKMMRRMNELTGAKFSMLRSEEEVQKIRDDKQAQMEQMQKDEEERNRSETARNVAQANAQNKNGYLGGEQ